MLRFAKAAVLVAAIVPAGLLIARATAGDLGANPIEAITHETGVWALRLLLATLAVTPLRRITGWNGAVRFRRMLGLLAFFYACLHVSTYLVLDQFFAFDAIWADIAKRPYITAGFTAFVLMVPLAATSTAAMIRRLGGRRWQQLHRLVYASATLGVIHYLWLVKADLRRPLIYAGVLVLLFAVRVWYAARRSSLPWKWPAGEVAARRH
jgi:sulfoxide reductase heme-binding subunit YedZ